MEEKISKSIATTIPCRCVVLLFACTVFISSALYGQSRWEQTSGPFELNGSRYVITSIVVDSSGALLAGTLRGGVLRSTDGGGHWNAMNEGLGVHFATLVNQSPFGSFWLQAREHLQRTPVIAQSSATSSRWKLLPPLQRPGNVVPLASDASGNVYAVADGLFRFAPREKNWLRLCEPAPIIGARAMCVDSGNTLLLSTLHGTLRSRDTGITWTTLGDSAQHASFEKIIPAHNGALFASARDCDSCPSTLYRSTDHGEHWESLATFSKTNHIVCIALFGASTIFIGTQQGMFVTDDAGAPVKKIENILAEKSIDVIAMDSAKRLWIASSRRMAKNHDGDKERIVSGFPGDDSEILESNLYCSADSGHTFRDMNTPLRKRAFVRALAIDSTGTLLAGTNTSGVFRSTDAGAHWLLCDSGLPSLKITALFVDHHGAVFAGVKSLGLFRSLDACGTWQMVGGKISQRVVTSITATSNGMMFATTTKGEGTTVFRSGDDGNSWSNDFASTEKPLRCSAADARGNFFLGGAAGVMRSTNGGKKWTQTNVDSSDMQDVSALCVLRDKQLVAGLLGYNVPVYVSTDDGAHWSPPSNAPWGTLGFITFAIIADSANHIFASIAGRERSGVYRSDDVGKTWSEDDEGMGNENISALCIDRNGVMFAASENGVLRKKISEEK